MEEQQFLARLYAAHQARGQKIPSPAEVCGWLEGLLTIMFPELAERRYRSERELSQHYQQLKLKLFSILQTIEEDLPAPAQDMEEAYLEQVPGIYDLLEMDADAILAGDPAAVSRTEVIRTYPGFRAIAVYRMAHAFYDLGIPLIPRVLTEHVHSLTGIDIHPAANIGERFCIDHGTGVVIGETVDIGKDVKIYQGVTLGALSVRKELAKMKRHPTIEDHVVIYSGATILGGDTVIGEGSIIGGNVWVTQSVPPRARIYYKNMERKQEVQHP